MTSLIRNTHSNAKMEFFSKRVGQQRYPNQFPKTHFMATLLARFKNRYVNANIKLE